MSTSIAHDASSQEVPLKTSKKITFIIIAILFAVVAIGLALEVTLRLIGRKADIGYLGLYAFVDDEKLGLRHAPGYEGTANRAGAFEMTVTIADNGLRQSNFAEQMQFPRKILLLGDSFTFGLGVAEDAAFASLIQPELNFAGVGVINAGQSGYCVTQEALFGMALADTIKPAAIVVAFYPGNDVKGDYFQDFRNVEVRYGYKMDKDRWLPNPALDFLRARSVALQILDIELKRDRLAELGKQFDQLAKDDIEQALAPTKAAFAMLSEYCQSNDIRLGVMMIPALGRATPFDAPMEAFFKTEGIPVLDLKNKKIRRSDYFQNDAHFNEKGHKKAAKYLVRFCEKLYRGSEAGQ